MAQSVMHLLCKRESLNSDPQNSGKKTGMALPTCNPSPEWMEVSGSQDLLEEATS